MTLKLYCFFEVIVVVDEYDDNFNVDELLMVMNFYMQIGDDIGDVLMYEKC